MGGNHKVSLRRRVQSWASLGSGSAAVEPPYYRTPTPLIGVKTGTSFVRRGKSESLKSYPHPGPGEAWGEAIKRAYLVDVNRAAEMIPRLGPEAVRGALTAIFEGVDPPAAIFKAAHDHGVVYLESSGKPQSPWAVKD